MKLVKSVKFAFFLALLACSAAPFGAHAGVPNVGKIEHFVVLMLENRAFDHLLGYLKSSNPQIDGLTGNEFNHVNPFDPNSPKVFVNPYGHYIVSDPAHSIPATGDQLYGNHTRADTSRPAPMSGFVASEQYHIGKIAPGSAVMSMFNATSAPVINTLASEFVVFDRFFSSVPGPTEVNRLFAQSATSYGLGYNNVLRLVEGVPQKTIFDQLNENGVSWGLYFAQVASSFFFTRMRTLRYVENYHSLNTFVDQARAGKLPHFSWLEPAYFSVPGEPAADQHPSHSLREGELLIKRIYEALRASPKWDKTAFIIMYDEHGGFYDHVSPPTKNVPNPDGMNSTKPVFAFDRLGVRIPFVVASPWVPKGSVEHAPPAAQRPTPDSQYEHTSVMSTVRKMMGVHSTLTRRDAWSATFEHIFSLSQPRTDCPTTLPTPPPAMFRKNLATEPSQSLHDLQESLAAATAVFYGDEDVIARGPREVLKNEGTAGLWAKNHFNRIKTRAAAQKRQ